MCEWLNGELIIFRLLRKWKKRIYKGNDFGEDRYFFGEIVKELCFYVLRSVIFFVVCRVINEEFKVK